MILKRYFSFILSGLILLVSISAINGCGWRLRGGLTLPDGLNLVHVSASDPSSSFGRNLTQLLQANGVTTVDSPQESQITITTGALEESRRVVSTGGNTLVTEYELESSVPFSVEDNLGNILIPTETATTTRAYEFDQNDIVGKAQEERLIQSEMQRELIQQIVRRLRFIDSSPQDSNPDEQKAE
ncbi:MAG: hypothetical protein K6L75_15560 [Cellvibrionaceae bacterium]